MSIFRQPKGELLVRSYAQVLRKGQTLSAHSHDWHQFFFSRTGLFEVNERDGLWLVPPDRGLLVPARCEHSLSALTAAHLQTLYLLPNSLPGLSSSRAVPITPLLRELVLEICRRGFLDDAELPERNLYKVLCDLLEPGSYQLRLELPVERPYRRVALDFLASPDIDSASVARRAGCSQRTLDRKFSRATGYPFGAWKRRARMFKALEHLLAGKTVTETALAVGYGSASAFISAFSRFFGKSPKKMLGSL